MASHPFVAREPELAQLQLSLASVVEGKGRVAFVAGEAGCGKTALLREFARIAQQVRADLVVAVGECNAQTGIGDPYLPFREILGMLSGDVEEKLEQGVITRENAARLRGMVGFSGQALVEMGPALINTFVPGTMLMALAVKFLAGRAGWLKSLQQLNERKTAPPSEGALEQNRVFEQYTRVLKTLADKQPLILILDDLQWADAASISLLFHLGRRIGESQIMIVCAYRPEEVALKRGNERHPLEKILAEFKREFGNIEMDLGEAAKDEARQFVDAYLDAEPNHLNEEFRQALVQHTSGHALFVVELLRTLEERGDILQDQQGCWVSGPELHWESLPARVEGVVQERVSRLAETEHALLRSASVQGMDFYADVLAQVEQMPLRDLLHELSQNLFKRHRLVREAGELKVGKQRLTAYQFAHSLFQRYLYGELSAGERRVLHGAVAHAIEQLYASQTDDACVRLAWHYDLAGDEDKAIDYLLQAGERALTQFAPLEAKKFFDRALELAPRDDRERRWRGLAARRSLADWLAEPDLEQSDIAALLELAEELDDDARRAEALMWKAISLAWRGQVSLALPDAGKAVELAQRAGDETTLASALHFTSTCHSMIGDYSKTVDFLTRSADISRRLSHQAQLRDALQGLGNAYSRLGRFKDAHAAFQETLELDQALGDRRRHAYTLGNLAAAYWRSGDGDTAIELEKQALTEFKFFEHVFGTATSLLFLGCFEEKAQDYSQAASRFAESRDLYLVLKNPARVNEATTGLARCELAQGHPDSARPLAIEIWEYIKARGVAGMAFPTHVYCRLAIVFEGLDDESAARTVIEAGHNDLMARAEKISDPAWRKSFLENVPEHRVLLATYKKMTLGQRGPS